MNKEIFVIFINNNLKSDFEKLEKGNFENKKLFEYINRAFDDLKKDPLSGIKIEKRLWPKFYIQTYKISNLRKYDLPNGWRLIYTIETDEVKVLNIIIEWFNHKVYERRFKY